MATPRDSDKALPETPQAPEPAGIETKDLTMPPTQDPKPTETKAAATKITAAHPLTYTDATGATVNLSPGDVADVPVEEAVRLIRVGWARLA